MKEPNQELNQEPNNAKQIAEILVENLKQATANENVDEVVMALKLFNMFLGTDPKEEELKVKEEST